MNESKVGDGLKRKLFDENEGREGSSDDESGGGGSSSSNNNSSEDSSVDHVERKKQKEVCATNENEHVTHKLTISSSYAKEYTSRKQREELRSKQQRYGRRDVFDDMEPTGNDDSAGSDSSSSEEEDEDGTLITPSMNLQFLKALKALRKKDSSIYKKETQFFHENQGVLGGNVRDAEKGNKRKPPVHFKDVMRQQILEQIDAEDEGTMIDDEGNDKPNKSSPTHASPSRLNYDLQQEQLRKAFLKESKISDDLSSEEDGNDNSDQNWMIMKQKLTTPGNGGEVDVAVKNELIEELQSKSEARPSSVYADPRGEIENGGRFLLDFIKNRKWIDKSHEDDGGDNSLADGGQGGRGNGDDDDASSLEDIDRADDFEANYNFRFELAAAETATSGAAYSVQSYARGQTMNTLRRKDETRRDKRLAKRERKIAQRKAKEEELKRLKNAKREEMNQKLNQIKSILGELDGDAVDEDAIMTMLEGEYDPDKFQQVMESTYGDSFYERDEKEWKTDSDVREALEKDDDGDELVGQDDLDGGLYDNDQDGEDEDGGDVENEEDSNYDFHHNEDFEDSRDIVDEQTSKLERKLKSKMQDELYKLDYEDIVAGMPTRFKYRQVEPNSYGLSTQEILLARDATLKQYVSLKKLAPYGEHEHAVGSKKRRRFREALMQEMKEEASVDAAGETVADDNEPTNVEESEMSELKKKKRRRLKKGRKKTKNAYDDSSSKAAGLEADTREGEIAGQSDAKRERRKKGRKSDENSEGGFVPESYEEGRQFEKLEGAVESDTHYSRQSLQKSKKKKRKRKKLAGVSASRLASYGL